MLTIEPFKAFGPHIFSLIDQPDKWKQTLADFARYYMAGSLGLALAIAMFSREIIAIMSDSAFYSSYRIIFVLCLSYVFYGLYSFSCYANNIVKKNWLISLSWLIAVIVSVSLNFILVPKYGMIEAMATSVIAYFVLVLANLIGASKIYPIRYKYAYFIAIMGFTIAFYYLGSLINIGIVLSICIKACLLALYIFIIYKSPYFSDRERAKIMSFLCYFGFFTQKNEKK
ncbi:MAG: polysaccharide biosynthesis C-terminal domain-containing protein [Candidatus Zixiibacteriota bacterium]